MKSLQIRGFLQAGSAATASESYTRMIIVYDKQANASAPTYANIMTAQDITGATESTFISMVNLDNRDRFVIIRDRNWMMGRVTTTATQTYSTANPVDINEYIKLNHETVFNAGSAGTVGDITTGSLYMFLINSTGGSAGVTMTWETRLRFIDP